MRPDQLTRASRPILAEYCRHVCRSRMLEGLIDGFSIERLKEDADYLPILDRLLAMAERETRAATACARTLRLTPQAQMHPRTAARRSQQDFGCSHLYELNDHNDIRKPWE